MKFVFYTHSLISDWNHGNAHFLRGVMTELVARGHECRALEPQDAWSLANLTADQGDTPVARFHQDFPELQTTRYHVDFDHEQAVADADVVIVHEWTDPALVARIGRARRDGGDFALLFHDTHHRAVSASDDIAGLSLEDYDAVLAFGGTLTEHYRRAGWGDAVFTWHEAADTRRFKPLPVDDKTAELVWIGNWGDGERSAELDTFLIRPVEELGLRATIHGVRYPADALRRLEQAGIAYEGWVANARVPEVFARHRVTVHVPRRPYVEALPGIPTIRMFEALACGIPLVSAPWRDAEQLFRAGEDFLFARDGEEMTRHLNAVLHDPDLADALAARGLETIRSRHTCAHRVDELLDILAARGTHRVRTALAQQEAAQ